MENSRERNLGPIWLNDNLFVIDGTPLKFHLHGYNEKESRSMTRIIEDFGGESSEPDASNTFVFCEGGCPFDPEEDRYNVQYFYDSIVALQPQELINYKINSQFNEQAWSVVDEHESQYLDIKEENNNNSDGSSNYKLVVTVDRVSPGPLDRVQVKTEEQQIKIELEDFYEEMEENRSESCQENDEDDIDFTLDESNDSSFDSSSFKSKRKIPFTKEDNKKIIKWIMKNKVVPTDFGTIIWEDMIRKKVLKDRKVAPYACAKHFREKLMGYPVFKKYIKDSRALRMSRKT